MSFSKFTKNAGFTLVEMMVAIVISMLVLTGVLQIFLNARNFYNLSTGFSQLQENGRFSILFLSRIIRLAGYRSPPSTGSFTDMTTVFTSAAPYVTGTNNAGFNSSDTLIVRYQGSGNGLGTPDGVIRDCLNRPVDAYQTVTNTFSLTNNSELQCQSVNPSAAPVTSTQILVSGVQNMQILFGEDVDGNGTVDRYVPANYATLNFNKVLSVRISLLLQSDLTTNLTQDSRTFNLLGQVFTTPTDQYQRQQVTSTFLLRNVLLNPAG